MQLEAIQLFCDIASEGSISGGARWRGVTQSAASQRIIALERELGVRLIDRGTRPLKLTLAGEIYRQGCREILDRHARLTRQIAAPAGVLGGSVRVAAIYSAGIDLLNGVARRFEAAHPGVTVRVDYLQPDSVHERVREARVDFGILSYPHRWPGLCTQPLRDETMVVVCRPAHALAVRDVLTPAELAGQPLVGFDSRLPIASQTRRYLRRNAGKPEVAHTFDNIDTIKAYVGHSDEVALLPYRTVAREVADGLLTAIALEPAFSRPVAIVTPAQRPQSAPARALIEALTAEGESGRALEQAAQPAAARKAIA